MIIPNFKAKNIFEVDLEFYKSLGISFLICDLDNTLDVYTCKEPTERVVEFTKKLKESGLNLLICSNNSKKRVEKYAKILKVSFI